MQNRHCEITFHSSVLGEEQYNNIERLLGSNSISGKSGCNDCTNSCAGCSGCGGTCSGSCSGSCTGNFGWS